MSDVQPWSDDDPGIAARQDDHEEIQPEGNRQLGGYASVLLALALLLTRMHL